MYLALLFLFPSLILAQSTLDLIPSEIVYKQGWSTSKQPFTNVKRVPLNDTVLGVTHVTATMPGHKLVTRDSKQAWEATYPKGSRNPSAPITGGFGFYISGSKEWNILQANEVVFSYSVLFEKGFEYQNGGKLPGLFGGVGDDAYGCSGGRQEERDKCFSLRNLWRAQGDGEIYAYLPFDAPSEKVLLAVPPKSVGSNETGFSIGRGSYRLVSGEWNYLAQRVKLNTINKRNGELTLWLNGQKVIDVKGIIIRQASGSTFGGATVGTFFGGSTDEYNSPKDQKAWFADFTGILVS